MKEKKNIRARRVDQKIKPQQMQRMKERKLKRATGQRKLGKRKVINNS